ncbi:MAG: hypothetical protein AABW87_00010 [Nanoarchaeota archaeon]
MTGRKGMAFHVIIIVLLGLAAIAVAFFSSFGRNNLADDVGSAVGEIERQFEEGNRMMAYIQYAGQFASCDAIKDDLKGGVVAGNDCMSIEGLPVLGNLERCKINRDNFRLGFLKHFKNKFNDYYKGRPFDFPENNYFFEVDVGEKFSVVGKAVKNLDVEGKNRYSIKPDFRVQNDFDFSKVEGIYSDIEGKRECLAKTDFSDLADDEKKLVRACELKNQDLNIRKIGDKLIVETDLNQKLCYYDKLRVKFVYQLTPAL